jgi:hypothetical protein
MKDHLITHIAEKTTKKQMYDAFVGLSQSSNVSRKMLLRNEILAICMSNIDTMVSYLDRIVELRDQLGTVEISAFFDF